MKLDKALRTIDLAREAGISVQQVRNYEAQGLLPRTTRSKSGYRLYTPQHLAALTTARTLVNGYGWQRTPEIMRALHRGNLATALATIDARHAELASKRLQAEQTLAALRILAAGSYSAPSFPPLKKFRIGEAARQVGVRVSALHFWEQQGLLHPIRDRDSHYRLYDEQQMQRLRMVALLREAGYGFPVIHSVLNELAAGHPEKAIAAVEKRQEELTRASWLCVESLTAFHRYVRAYHNPDHTSASSTCPD